MDILRVLKRLIKLAVGLLVLSFVVLIFLVRFTDGHVSSPSKIILGYDHEEARFQFWEQKVQKLKGIDGPYVLGDSLFRVDKRSRLSGKPFVSNELIDVLVGNKDRDAFAFRLRDTLVVDKGIWEMPSKLLAISDIEGNFNAFQSFLFANDVIDKNFNWTYDSGHLVLVGDFVDRGTQVTEVLWLIYHLENQAKAQGGQVHFVVGNHEVMNLEGSVRYVNPKYLKVAQILTGESESKKALPKLYNEAVFGDWFRSQNVIEKIGSYIFTHGGISPKLLKSDLGIDEINAIAREYMGTDLDPESSIENVAKFILGNEGPLWFRGLVMNADDYKKVSASKFGEILKHFDAGYIVVGHTVEEQVTTDFEGRLIKIDVKHGKDKGSAKTQGLLIEAGRHFRVDAKGSKAEL